MGTLIFIIIGLLALVLAFNAYKHETKLQPLIPTLKNAIIDWERIFEKNHFVRFSTLVQWKEKYNLNGLNLPKNLILSPLNSEDKAIIKRLNDILADDIDFRSRHNKMVVSQDKKTYSSILNTASQVKLDGQQLDAVFNNEDNNLVVAGAGTGKTSTLIAKTAYILEKGLAKSNEILCIAFTKSAAVEMQERLAAQVKNGNEIPVKTFHSIGYDIIGKVEGSKPAIWLENKKDKEQFFAKELNKLFVNNSTKEKAIDFFFYHLTNEKNEEQYETLDEYYKAIKSIGLRTIKGHSVKSYQELAISNYLFLNGVNYEYEKQYPVESEKDPDYRVYQPDFYLTDYDIYLEHFGIDREGRVPKSRPDLNGLPASEHYQQGMDWKRGCHERNNTKLLETFSYEFTEGSIFDNLNEMLIENSVQLNPLSSTDILTSLKDREEIPLFINLTITFLSLFKSSGLAISELKKRPFNRRSSLFLELFKELYSAYTKELENQKMIDFNDMIGRATAYISNGQFNSSYKYILVDEFQDLSLNRYQLLRSLQSSNDSILFGVGDDWQSIFRFTGSDLSLMTKFQSYFGHTYQANIEKTFRFSQNLVDISSKFVTNNPNQITKKLVSSNSPVEDPVEVTYTSTSSNTIREKLNIIKAEKPDASVFILGRYNHDLPKELNQFKYEYESLDIQFHTIHRSKGLTCDYAIVVNVNSGKLGFPTEVVDDPLLLMVMNKVDNYPNSEERRVFYVALTRARYKVFILTSAEAKSSFVDEIEKLTKSQSVLSVEKCPQCNGQLMEREGPFGNFLGCQHYPLCNFSTKMQIQESNLEMVS